MNETLKKLSTLLGASDDATEEQVFSMLGDKLAVKPVVKTEPIPEPVEDPKELFSKLFATEMAQVRKEVAEEFAVKEKKARVDAALDKAVADGKIFAAEREEFAVMANASPEKFSSMVDKMPKRVPTETTVKAGGKDVDLGKPPKTEDEVADEDFNRPISKDRTDWLTEVARFASSHNCTFIEAEGLLKTQKAAEAAKAAA